MKPSARVAEIHVVEDHNDALIYIHEAIRSKKLPFSGARLVHFDAHPDLSVPIAIPAQTIFRPRELYDALDESESGIAEWIIPLIYAGHVSRVCWLKPEWATQMREGDFSIHVGQLASGRLAVSSAITYFLEDDQYAPLDAIQDPRLWDLHVRTVKPRSPRLSSSLPVEVQAEAGTWILDICMDFFSTSSPFREEFLTACGYDNLAILTKVFSTPRYKTCESLSDDARIKEKEVFARVMDKVFRDSLFNMEQDLFAHAVEELLPLYDEDDRQTRDLLLTFRTMLRSLTPTHVALARECGPFMDLPHHRAGRDDIMKLLKQVEDVIRSIGTRPDVITVCRSSRDGYTPSDVVEFIEENVLSMLKHIYLETNVLLHYAGD